MNCYENLIIMENKLNLIEILRDCPSGMELNCTLCDNVVFERIDFGLPKYPIIVRRIETNQTIYLTEYGQYSVEEYYKCIIFPKGKTTWEGFVPPCKFNDGDVVVAEGKSCQLFLLKHVKYREDNNGYDGYCYFGWDFLDNRLFEEGNWGFNRLATEEEKTKLFATIKANGYKWDEKTKTLEIVPKFKVGNRIIPKDFKNKSRVINAILDNEYNLFGGGRIPFSDQDNWELIPDKFDITTLKPFDKVLTRENDKDSWVCNLYSHRIKDYYVILNAELASQCIPYEPNKHLLDTTNDCCDFYKTWE